MDGSHPVPPVPAASHCSRGLPGLLSLKRPYGQHPTDAGTGCKAMASKSKNGIEAANGKFRFVFRTNGDKQRGPWVDTHAEAKRLMGEKQAVLFNVTTATE